MKWRRRRPLPTPPPRRRVLSAAYVSITGAGMPDVGRGAPPVLCDRCGAEANVMWVDVSEMGKPPGKHFGSATCPTAGCVDEGGSRQVPPPDVPGELTREDRRWIRRQEQLAADFALADRLLRQATVDH